MTTRYYRKVRTEERLAAALDVDCPYCKRPPESACSTHKGRTRRPHFGRLEAGDLLKARQRVTKQRNEDLLRMECPTCGALPSHPCAYFGEPVEPHVERFIALSRSQRQ